MPNTVKQPELKEYKIDAAGQKLGRVASEVAVILQGKKTAVYNPRLIGSAKVVVQNVSKIEVSGNKAEQKIYYHHTGQIGHLKEESYKMLFGRAPERVVWKAVYNMLPKNRLRNERMKRLKIEL